MTPLDLSEPAMRSWEADRDILLAMLDQAIEHHARIEAPPEAERHDWVYGSLGFTEPDQHGWKALTTPKLWMPRALCFWRGAVNGGAFIDRGHSEYPGHALTPWPDIECAVASYLAVYPWLIAEPATLQRNAP